ncbi:zinc-binding alcohol dehydrogenase family protein [Mycolicibacterium sp. F2034L]|uniref:zinc-binding alcohol dehydrogenase family protein n=1 Tax=Mycolicibacterium sp. F2034L TaxID=2926422 RepID=UPI001FF17765|nr:zinc-binding alcohol dehydrogenase family protein [Mycolicibacterium sp. F2034L]MCK0174679.1 zinc-binding alcohol dehydrogenase family protein [Mycolicibacterium sp. F2034L]
MKALAYERAHPVDAFALDHIEVDEPVPRDSDLLVDIRAIGVNPGEALIRSVRSAEPGGRLILGWEFAGVVVETGSSATGFAAGDRVMGTGDLARDGCWAERVAVDHRLVAKIPEQLPFADAASLPIGALTGWEAMFRDQPALPPGVERILIVGGAGGVGSLATQLLKARTEALVISTASRPQSRAWCRTMGADLVVDHASDVLEQLGNNGIEQVDMVLSTAGTVDNLPWIGALLRPFGHLSTVDLGAPLDLAPLTQKSISLHTEMVFSRPGGGTGPVNQSCILNTISEYVVSGQLRPIATTKLTGLTVDNMKTAHTLIESRRTIGKIVIET